MMTSSAISCSTLSIPGHMADSWVELPRLSVARKIISFVFMRVKLRLQPCAQCWMCTNSSSLLVVHSSGSIRYVSNDYVRRQHISNSARRIGLVSYLVMAADLRPVICKKNRMIKFADDFYTWWVADLLPLQGWTVAPAQILGLHLRGWGLLRDLTRIFCAMRVIVDCWIIDTRYRVPLKTYHSKNCTHWMRLAPVAAQTEFSLTLFGNTIHWSLSLVILFHTGDLKWCVDM